MNSLARFGLIAVLGTAGATTSVAQEAVEEIPRPALMELLRHVDAAGKRPGHPHSFAVVRGRSAGRPAVAEAAQSSGFALYDSYDDILRCSNQTPPTCGFAVGDRVGAIQAARVNGDTIVVRFVVSTFLRRKDGVARLSPALHEITLRRSQGRWQVQEDRVLFKG